MTPPSPSLTELARSTAAVWNAHPDDLAARSRCHQAVLRLYYSPLPSDVVGERLGLDRAEVLRIVYRQMHLLPSIIRASERTCTFCGRMRSQVTSLVDGCGVSICAACTAAAQAVLQNGSDVERPDWLLAAPIGPPKCDFCGRVDVDGVVVPARYAHICAGCIDQAAAEQ